MSVNPDRNTDDLFESNDNVFGCLRWDETSHVLDDDGIGSHFLKLSAEFDKAFDVMHWAAGVANHTVSFFSCGFGSFDRKFHIARIVQGIENTEDIHAVFGGSMNKCLNHVIGEVGVLDDVLPPK